MKNVKKVEMKIENKASEIVNPVPPVVPVPPAKTEIELLREQIAKETAEKATLLAKVINLESKKLPGFKKTGICAHEVLFQDLVASLTKESIVQSESEYLNSLKYAVLAPKAQSVSQVKSYLESSAAFDSKYFKRVLDAIRVRFDLVEIPKADGKADPAKPEAEAVVSVVAK